MNDREKANADALRYMQEGDLNSAFRTLQECLVRHPGDPETHKNLGNLYLGIGRPDEAAMSYRKALATAPDYLPALNNLGMALNHMGQWAEAAPPLERAFALDAEDPDILNNLGVSRIGEGRTDEAIDLLRQAIALREPDPTAHANLAAALLAKGGGDDAVTHAWRAVALDPKRADNHIALAEAYRSIGRADAADGAYRDALHIDPDRRTLWNSLIYNDLHDPEGDNRRLAADLAEHDRRFIAPRIADADAAFENKPDPDKRLRVGYVSNDFNYHSMRAFLVPVIEGHDRFEVEVFCYSTNPHTDPLTERYRAAADHWRDIWELDDAEAADLIDDDGIDVLVDMIGLTEGNRLGLFAYRPAPVQVTWLGCPCSTGSSVIDTWISDGFISGPGAETEPHAEHLTLLPGFYAAFRADPAPEPGPLPALDNGFVTFGSFNAVPKLTNHMIGLWAKVLGRLPNSRLIMIAAPEGSVRDRVRRACEAEGVAADRLEFHPRISHEDFVEIHQRIDISLDTFPCVGTTTTLYNFWMGVPMVTMVGDRFAARVGYSIAANLGLAERLAAKTDEQFVDLAVALASDVPALAELRAGLRSHMAASPLADMPNFIANLEAAYRGRWREWCQEL